MVMYKSLIKSGRTDEAHEFFRNQQKKYDRISRMILFLGIGGGLIVYFDIGAGLVYVVAGYLLGYFYCKNLWNKKIDTECFYRASDEHLGDLGKTDPET